MGNAFAKDTDLYLVDGERLNEKELEVLVASCPHLVWRKEVLENRTYYLGYQDPQIRGSITFGQGKLAYDSARKENDAFLQRELGVTNEQGNAILEGLSQKGVIKVIPLLEPNLEFAWLKDVTLLFKKKED